MRKWGKGGKRGKRGKEGEKGERGGKGENEWMNGEKFVKLVKPKHYNSLSAAGAQAAVCLKFGGRLSHDVNCHSINFILVFWIITLRQPCGATSIFDGFIFIFFVETTTPDHSKNCLRCFLTFF